MVRHVMVGGQECAEVYLEEHNEWVRLTSEQTNHMRAQERLMQEAMARVVKAREDLAPICKVLFSQ